MKIKKLELFIFFLFLLLLNTKSLEIEQNKLSSTIKDDEMATELTIGKSVSFSSLDNNYFKYINHNNTNKTIFFSIKNPIYNYLLEIKDPEGEKEVIELNDEIFKVTLMKLGPYYFKFKANNMFFNLKNEFVTMTPGMIIDRINLNKAVYYNKIFIREKESYQPTIYKVDALKAKRYAYFDYQEKEKYNNPFQICVNENESCIFNVKFFCFDSEKNYTIYINFVKKENENDDNYYYIPFIIIPLYGNHIESRTTKTLTILSDSDPKLYIINLEKKGTIYAHFKYFHKILMASSNEEINRNDLEKMISLNYTEIEDNDTIVEFNNDYKCSLLLVLPKIFEIEGLSTRLAFADNKIENITNNEINFSSGKTAIIFLPSNYYSDKTPLNFYNILTTYSSHENSMRYLYSNDLNDKYNFLLSNYEKIPIFIESISQKKIDVKTYFPRFTLFGVIDTDMLLLYNDLYKNSAQSRSGYDLESIFPINIRVNSDLSEFNEFLNLYSHYLRVSINFYIKKFFGDTTLYECSNELNLYDLSILTTPFNNCEDKQSIFNRLFTFKGTKILSGYLSSNSYMDIYLELNDDSRKIKISPIINGTFNSASKYIKKGEIYTIDFTVDHMVKIEILDNIQVTIYNDNSTIKLNSENPNAEIKGNKYYVKTNINTMIYFYGRLFKLIKQVELDPNQNGKYLTINTNKEEISYAIDSGFKGYNPLNIGLFSKNKIRNDSTLYIENIYDRMKNLLVKNENMYLYYINPEDDEDVKIEISYYDSLNNPNNDYTFTVIPGNSEEKSLIIYNAIKEKIHYQVNFCGEPHNVKMLYKSKSDEEYNELIFTAEKTAYYEDIEESGTKINFKSDKEFIFSYSFDDKAEEKFKNYEPWYNERKELTDLKIIQVIDKYSDDNILSITFKPNYKNSNTKYIIVIVTGNKRYTVENLSNPCFIAKLVNIREDGVKIENVFDPGLNDTITVYVDINDILDKENNNYVVGIISQELRYEKKLNFYSALNFYHEPKEKKKNKKNTLAILLPIIGIIIIIVASFIIIFYYKRKKKIDNDLSLENNKKLLAEL